MRAHALSASQLMLPAWSRLPPSYALFPTAEWMTPRPATPLLPHDRCRVRVAPSQGASLNLLPNNEAANQLQPAGSLRCFAGFQRIDLQRISCSAPFASTMCSRQTECEAHIHRLHVSPPNIHSGGIARRDKAKLGCRDSKRAIPDSGCRSAFQCSAFLPARACARFALRPCILKQHIRGMTGLIQFPTSGC
jgi:hypothetical protein